MRHTTRSIRTLVILFAMILAALVAPATAAPAPVPAECADGGYAAWDRGDGTPFRNANQCAKFVKNGGVLVPLVPATGAVSVSFIRVAEPDVYCRPVITVSGFASGTYTVTPQAIEYMYHQGELYYRIPYEQPTMSVTVDVSGTGSVELGTAIMASAPELPADPSGVYWYIQATVSGISSAETIVWC